MNKNLRMYVLTNRYLSGIQQGIQALHAAIEMAQSELRHDIFKEWAWHHKTVIVLEGGNSRALEEFAVIAAGQSRWGWSQFREDEESLNGAITAVAMVLPESVYTGKSRNSVDRKIYNWIKDLPLAR